MDNEVQAIGRGKAREVSISAVVIRCRCGDPDSHRGEVCPRGEREDRGTVSYWHRNPLKRFYYWFETVFKKRRVQR
ncbi:MAG: hypothetical protein AABN33_18395 [Acidobacteriota bacterium]